MASPLCTTENTSVELSAGLCCGEVGGSMAFRSGSSPVHRRRHRTIEPVQCLAGRCATAADQETLEPDPATPRQNPAPY